ncbi:TPM domain-containing protein [Polaromonas sp.]|uniref:TPM domain-containing protein n=1 Tax=Polaromonas sp. TaxID=1869339 RepID=UPI003263C71D
MPHRQPSLPSLQFRPTHPTRHLYKTLAVLWAALCVLAAGAMAQPTDAAQAPEPTDVTAVARPTDSVRVAVPPYSARVLDTTGTLHTTHIAELNQQILALEADTRAAVVVLMVQTTGDEAIEQYATRVFEKWKIGDAERDDGILILVATEDRRMRIEVGQGLEGTVPDVLAGRIIDQDMKPRFRSNDYAGGLKAAINSIGTRVRGDTQPLSSEESGGITPFGWAFFATLMWGFAVGAVRAHRTWKWPVTVGVLAAMPLVAAAVLREPGMGFVLLSFPAPLTFALGFGCGRSRAMRMVVSGIALAIGLLVGIAHAVGADRFGWGFLYAVVGGVGCLLLGLIAMGVRRAYKRSLVELGVRSAVVTGIAAYVAFENPPGPFGPDWTSWLPVGMATGLAMLFAFFPSGVSSSSDSGGRSSSGGSSSSNSSSSRSSSGGSSSGGGASGSW